MPGYPAVNTKGMNIIRNLSDDEEIPLRNHGGAGNQGVDDEFKQEEDEDQHMVQHNPKKRGRHELESQQQHHDEFQ